MRRLDILSFGVISFPFLVHLKGISSIPYFVSLPLCYCSIERLAGECLDLLGLFRVNLERVGPESVPQIPFSDFKRSLHLISNAALVAKSRSINISTYLFCLGLQRIFGELTLLIVLVNNFFQEGMKLGLSEDCNIRDKEGNGLLRSRIFYAPDGPLKSASGPATFRARETHANRRSGRLMI